jgi:hypothetical protein
MNIQIVVFRLREKCSLKDGLPDFPDIGPLRRLLSVSDFPLTGKSAVM